MNATKRPEQYMVSLVVPAYNEAECVTKLADELTKIFRELTANYEIVYVDDGSRDQTFTRITELSLKDSRIRGISLSRNVGHQAALAAGLDAARGDVVITIDADLQHPPELIPQMLAAWQDGFDVVNTLRRRSVSTDALGEKLSKLFYWIFNKTSDVKLVPDSPDFRLLDRSCVEALKSMPERLKFFRGMVPYIGFRQTNLTFDCPPRFAGERSYTLRKSMKMAYDGILSFSDIGLKIPFVLGLIITAVALLYLMVSIVLILSGVTTLAQGWASLITLNVLILGLNLTFVGIFGLYIGKIFNEVKRRPLYFIRTTVGGHGAARVSEPPREPG